MPIRGFFASLSAWRAWKSQYRALNGQAFGPVRWFETVQAIRALGIAHLIECGPGKVLTGMNRRIAADLQAMAYAPMRDSLFAWQPWTVARASPCWLKPPALSPPQ